MKKLCRNCGAKVPKKAEICPKCGEPYEYIDLVRLDPEEEKLIQVDKPSVMPNVCALILSIAAFCYALTLIWMHFKDNTMSEAKKPSEASLTDEVSEPAETAPADFSEVHYNAVDFLGMSFSDVTKLLGDRYSIKISDTVAAEFMDFPVTVSTLESQLTDDAPISKVIVSGNGQISPVASADMTFEELKIVLSLKENAPELNEKDAFYYAHTNFDNGVCKISADFKFDNEAIDRAPIEVILTDISLNVPKVMGTVTGIDQDDVLNMRAEPSYDADSIDELTNGAQLEIIDTVTDSDGNEWYKVKSGDKEGFVSKEYVVKNDEIRNIDNSSSEPEESEDEDDEDENDESEDEDDESDDEYDEDYE
ncbi:SH3 domain-containing protein [Ruminococcus sp. HUN007]|uniref:SH3 domain-containing protein n=1 Tax=Ruminococcus sp. HUN007 TaxID=1514668 RepID=UPI00067869FB|nr:SH3 domain-containing protein [Ruminococcus sp. HUN007]